MKEKKEFLINIAYYGVVIAIAWVLLKYLLPVAMPFLLGYCVAILVCNATAKCKQSKKLIRDLMLLKGLMHHQRDRKKL